MKCPKCETVNPADSKFCKECATPLRLGTKDQASFTKTLETTTDELARGTVFAGRVDWGAVYARSYYKLGRVYEQM